MKQKLEWMLDCQLKHDYIGKKSYSIGFFRGDSKLFPNYGQAVCMSFINHEGLPSISEFSYMYDNFNYNIKILIRDTLKYKVEKIEKNFEYIPDSIYLFKQWIDEHRHLLKPSGFD